MAAATEARPTDVGYGFNNGLDLNGMMLGFDDLYVEDDVLVQDRAMPRDPGVSAMPVNAKDVSREAGVDRQAIGYSPCFRVALPAPNHRRQSSLWNSLRPQSV